jgi:hypothetical protein
VATIDPRRRRKRKKPVAYTFWCRSTGWAAARDFLDLQLTDAHTTDLQGRLTRFRSVWCFIVNMLAREYTERPRFRQPKSVGSCT